MTGPLAGVRIVELSSFVAVPLAGMTLAQLGADVIRVDPVSGGADHHRWPVTNDGESIYWAGLNKGKRSVAVDLRSPEGRDLVLRLIVDCGILITNTVGRQWHSFGELAKLRPDIIHVEISGRADGSTGVDYTVNAATGFPMVTGPTASSEPINSVVPAWDLACGLYAALAVVSALRECASTGEGQRISIPLENVALAAASNLGFLTEVMVTGNQRQRLGNSLYGTYGQHFTSSDGTAFMVVALTPRHFTNLVEVTGATAAVAALAGALNVDFSEESARFRHRAALSGLFCRWFEDHDARHVAKALAATSVLWERYRSFAEVVAEGGLASNPMFAELDQPRIGAHLAAGLPISIGGDYPLPVAAPALGEHTSVVLRERLGMTADDVDRLVDAGTIAGIRDADGGPTEQPRPRKLVN